VYLVIIGAAYWLGNEAHLDDAHQATVPERKCTLSQQGGPQCHSPTGRHPRSPTDCTDSR
jgi:hypothetical protein